MTGETSALAQAVTEAIDRVVACLDGLDAQALNWRPPAPDTNSLYVIATHVLGNAEECILEILGGHAINRKRREEFLAEGAAGLSIVERWQQRRDEMRRVVEALSTDDLEHLYQHRRRGELSGRAVLLLVIRHASEHLGEAQLTRALALAR